MYTTLYFFDFPLQSVWVSFTGCWEIDGYIKTLLHWLAFRFFSTLYVSLIYALFLAGSIFSYTILYYATHGQRASIYYIDYIYPHFCLLITGLSTSR